MRSGCPLIKACSAVLAALVTIAVSGCGGSDDRDVAPSIPVELLPQLVLQPTDLPAGYLQFDAGEIADTDVVEGPRADRTRFDRQGGHKARYRQPPSGNVAGPLTVVSMVDLFQGQDGAERDFEAYREQFTEEIETSPYEAELIEVEQIGEGTIAMTLLQEGGETDLRTYTLAWRAANVTASVSVQGFEGQVTLEDALELARKQHERLDAAAAPS